MAFQDLRENDKVYLLHKDGKPYIEKGIVTAAPKTRLEQPKTQTFGQMQVPFSVVDLTVKTDDINNNIEGLPANLELYDIGSNCVLAIGKDAMNRYVETMRTQSQKFLDTVEDETLRHQSIVEGCDEIVQVLNPEIAEQQRRDKEVKDLTNKVDNLTDAVGTLAGAVDKLLDQLGSKPNKKN